MYDGLRFALTADRQRIAYSLESKHQRDQSAVRVVLIHALAMDRSNWDGVVAQLPDSFSIITLDCRGHGRSDAGDAEFDAELFADDVAAVMDDAGWADALIAGCSMGGCVAMTFAARHPARTAGLVLIDTTAWYGPSAAQDWAARAGRAKAEGLQSLVGFQRERWFSAPFRDAHPQQVQQFIDVFLRNDVDAYVSTCMMLGGFDARDRLAQITCPTMVIVGENDYATPIAFSEHLHQAIAGSQLTIVPGACHFTPIETPGAIAEALIGVADKSLQAS